MNVEAALPHCCLLGFYLLVGTASQARQGTEHLQGAWVGWALPAPLLCPVGAPGDPSPLENSWFSSLSHRRAGRDRQAASVSSWWFLHHHCTAPAHTRNSSSSHPFSPIFLPSSSHGMRSGKHSRAKQALEMLFTHPWPGLQEDLASPVSCLLLPTADSRSSAISRERFRKNLQMQIERVDLDSAGRSGVLLLHHRIPGEAELEGTNIPTHLDFTAPPVFGSTFQLLPAHSSFHQHLPQQEIAGGGGGSVQLPWLRHSASSFP